MTPDQAAKIREVLSAMPKAAAASVGKPPTPEQIYALPAHASALDPDVSLVVGNRGMGKTFWASALFDPETRSVAARAFPSVRRSVLDKVDVFFGFADREGVVGVSSTDIERASKGDLEAVWRGVILHVISGNALGSKMALTEAVDLATEKPDETRQLLKRFDDHFRSTGRSCLVLFDQLDQLADDWPRIQDLTKALLKTALAMKSYRALRLKIFMRSDQFADDNLFQFADASKIWGERAHLRWYSVDLYGMLYAWLWRHPESASIITQISTRAGGSDLAVDPAFQIPHWLAADPKLQGLVFDQIAGDKMGGGSKRGRPYSWIPAHLADGRNEISPRSFITAIRVAADRAPETSSELAIDYRRIQEGVREASDHRHRELEEDYPWMKEALAPLHGMIVPVERSSIRVKWSKEKTPEHILGRYLNTKAPIEVISAANDEKSRNLGLEHALISIGVFEERTDARVNIPDIFRISAGIKRKGGITPQQRRRV